MQIYPETSTSYNKVGRDGIKSGFRAALVTTDARLYAWDLVEGRSLMRSESISSLLTPADSAKLNPVNISKLNFSETGQLVRSIFL